MDRHECEPVALQLIMVIHDADRVRHKSILLESGFYNDMDFIHR